MKLQITNWDDDQPIQERKMQRKEKTDIVHIVYA